MRLSYLLHVFYLAVFAGLFFVDRSFAAGADGAASPVFAHAWAVQAAVVMLLSAGLFTYTMRRSFARSGVRRPSPKGEAPEHNAALSPGLEAMENVLSQVVEGRLVVGRRVSVPLGDACEEVASLVNRLIDRLEDQSGGRGDLAQLQSDREERERVAALASATFEAIVIHRNGRVIDGNEQFATLVGRSLGELIGTSILDFLRDGDGKPIGDLGQLNDGANHEIFIQRPDGERVPVRERGRDIVYRGENVRVKCFVDLRERRLAESRIRFLAQHDPLTRLPNRTLFAERLNGLIAGGARASRFGVLKIDLDRFKDINDIHGHHAADLVVRETARRLGEVTGERGIAARLGGDEFAIILIPVDGEEDIEAFGAGILQAMAAPIDIGAEKRVDVTASIGMAAFPDHADDMDGLLGCADMALSLAKSSGRNACRIFKPGMNDLMEKRRALEADLDLALKNREFKLYLQPRVDAASGKVLGYEALLRWFHPERGMINPGDFIPVAEASGKIIQIGEWVLVEACRLLDSVSGQISVNVSPLQFRHTDFVASLVELIRRTGADPRRIELEITENVLIDDDKRAFQILTDLKAIGFGIALDDFGTGYSSLSYLSRYPFDTIKIDRSFVSNLGSVANAKVIVKTIIDLGTGLGMKTVAEGVEKIEEAVFLSQAGCDQLQGFLLGRPVQADERLQEIDTVVAARLRSISRRGRESQEEFRTALFSGRL